MAYLVVIPQQLTSWRRAECGPPTPLLLHAERDERVAALTGVVPEDGEAALRGVAVREGEGLAAARGEGQGARAGGSGTGRLLRSRERQCPRVHQLCRVQDESDKESSSGEWEHRALQHSVVPEAVVGTEAEAEAASFLAATTASGVAA